MNRRDFLKALGLATGAFVGSVSTTGATWPDKVEPLRRRHGAVAEDKAKWGDIRIDGTWYTLDRANIEMICTPIETTQPGDKARMYKPGEVKWTLDGRTRSTIPVRLLAALGEVDVLIATLGASSNYAGKALVSSVEVNVYTELVNSFVLTGVGPLVKN